MTPTLDVRPIHVAVLDDHPIVRHSLSKSLEAAGMKVTVAASANEFFAALPFDQQAIAIVDLNLEDAMTGATVSPSGPQVLSRLAADHPSVRAIVFSADSRPETINRCAELGAWSYLTKLRSEPEELVEAVKRVAAGERYSPEPFFAGSLKAGAFGIKPSGGPLTALTAREREVLSYVSVGADNLKIASHLEITERTVRAHIGNLYAKLGSENRTQLALLARQLGIGSPPGY